MGENDGFTDQIEELRTEDLADSRVLEEEVMEILLNTREQGQMMEQLIKNQIEVKDAMIDKLHKELDYYKQNLADRFVDQLMKAVIKLRKDMKKMILSEQWGEMSAEELRREYQYALEDLTDLLEQQNFDPYSSSAGEDFDASLHQARVEVTEDPALDKKIKESLSEGYKKEGKVFMPERVVVYQYKS